MRDLFASIRNEEARRALPCLPQALTVGVLNRVHELSDRDEPKLSKAFCSLIPLGEILGEILDCGPTAKKVLSFYEDFSQPSALNSTF